MTMPFADLLDHFAAHPSKPRSQQLRSDAGRTLHRRGTYRRRAILETLEDRPARDLRLSLV